MQDGHGMGALGHDRDGLPSPTIPRVLKNLWGAHAAASLVGILVLFSQAAAVPIPVKARVVWVHGGRAYIAGTDTLTLEDGDLVTFRSRGKTVAAGEVSGFHDEVMAVARVTSGSLARIKKLESLQVLAEHPALRPAPVLRIGTPSRSNPLFECGRVTPYPPLPQGAYRSEPLSEHSQRLVRDPAVVVQAPWPDTLLIRMFDEFTDEEIALERDELDVAIFWPGELSSHIREQPRWRGYLSGARSRGIVAAIELSPDAHASAHHPVFDRSALTSFNDDLFRGDLARWEGAWKPGAGSVFSPDSVSLGATRYEVDASCPGWQSLERFLNRGPRPLGQQASRVVRLVYLDASIDSTDSPSLGMTRLFTIRCPVVCEARLRSYVRALGPDALADMLNCAPPRRTP